METMLIMYIPRNITDIGYILNTLFVGYIIGGIVSHKPLIKTKEESTKYTCMWLYPFIVLVSVLIMSLTLMDENLSIRSAMDIIHQLATGVFAVCLGVYIHPDWDKDSGRKDKILNILGITLSVAIIAFTLYGNSYEDGLISILLDIFTGVAITLMCITCNNMEIKDKAKNKDKDKAKNTIIHKQHLEYIKRRLLLLLYVIAIDKVSLIPAYIISIFCEVLESDALIDIAETLIFNAFEISILISPIILKLLYERRERVLNKKEK